nr:hypothetical protein [Caballeronia sp. PC1]
MNSPIVSVPPLALRPSPAKLEHDRRKRLEIADDEGEGADIEGFPDQPLDHVLVGAPGPE